MGESHLVGAREVIEKSLQLFDGFDGFALIKLRFGRIEIVGVARVVACEFGEFSFGIALIVGFEKFGGFGIFFVLEVDESEQVERLLGPVAPF